MKSVEGRMGIITYEVSPGKGVDEQALLAVISAVFSVIMNLSKNQPRQGAETTGQAIAKAVPGNDTFIKPGQLVQAGIPTSRPLGNCAVCGNSLSQRIHIGCCNP